MSTSGHRYFVLHKPYGMESQFIKKEPGTLLGELPFAFPEGIHAIGRLDKHSEGLLLLTTNKKITALLFQSKVPHKRTYLVQVKYKVTPEALERLRTGVSIRIKGGEYYTTPPCEVHIVEPPSDFFASPYPIHENVENAWLTITLTEGKYHQVRKMVLAVRHRCIRLIRLSIEDLELGNLQPGMLKEITEEDFFRLLRLGPPAINPTISSRIH